MGHSTAALGRSRERAETQRRKRSDEGMAMGDGMFEEQRGEDDGSGSEVRERRVCCPPTRVVPVASRQSVRMSVRPLDFNPSVRQDPNLFFVDGLAVHKKNKNKNSWTGYLQGFHIGRIVHPSVRPVR